MDDFEARRKMNEIKKQVGKDSIQARPPTPPKASLGRKLLKGVKWIGILALCGGAFVAGRYSTHPAVIHLIPAPALATPTSDASPEDIIQAYFDAAQRQDMERVLALCEPEYAKQNDRHLISEAKQLSTALPGKELKILQQQIEETAFVTVNLVDINGRSEMGRFRLKKINGQWRFTSVYF